jgi:hypothetical protein
MIEISRSLGLHALQPGKAWSCETSRGLAAFVASSMRGQGALSGRMDGRQQRATRDGRTALTEVAECASRQGKNSSGHPGAGRGPCRRGTAIAEVLSLFENFGTAV